MARYEAHLTMDREHAKTVEELAPTHGWTYSVITGCPLLGQGTYCYLTGYDAEAVRLKSRMRDLVRHLEHRGITPLRQKIERIVFDTKTGVDELQHQVASLEKTELLVEIERQHRAESRHTCITDDGGTPNRRCYACEQEKEG